MFRITRKLFVDLTIWMIGFGILIGIVFPFFITIIGVPSEITFTPNFFFLCISAGLLVGTINICLARSIIGKRLKLLTDRMSFVEKNLKNYVLKDNLSIEIPNNYFVDVDSNDEIGATANAFNSLVDTLYISLRKETSMRKYTEMLTSNLDIDALSKEALKQLMTLTKADSGAIIIETKEKVEILASLGINKPNKLLKNKTVSDVSKSNHRFNAYVLDDSFFNSELEEFNKKEIIIEPIEYKHNQIGSILLTNKNEFSIDIKNNLHIYSQSLALALNNALVHNKVQKLASVDYLTNIFNRRYGLKKLHEEFVQANKIGTPLSILMLDIDYFKKINDTFGHSIGDKVLCEITHIIHSVLRDEDILVRYGGEEFIAILKSVSSKNVYTIANRIRLLIEKNSIGCCERKINVTISIGAASIPDSYISSTQELIDAADKALYSAKNSGRNKVILFSDELKANLNSQINTM